MTSLSTTYLGLKLRNPLVVSSSSLTDSPDKLQRLQEAGAGAVVLKSVFEEQIELEAQKLDQSLNAAEELSAEATRMFADIPFDVGPGEYLNLVEKSKRAVSIPVIASMNCLHGGKWGAFAKKIASAGADALELNLYSLQTNPEKTGAQVENEYLDAVSEVRAAVRIPLAIKLSPFFSSIPNMVAQLAARGANAAVLFNRFFQPNLDIFAMKSVARLHLSQPDDALLPLRWIGLLHGRVPNIELAATSGILDGQTALKMILAGARVSMVCSAIFRNKEQHLTHMLAEMEAWMRAKEYQSIDEVRGILSQKSNPEAQAFERSQYIKSLVGFD
ncbi:MAG: dihydroorotate dehydrogenase-like protein [Deltaproteobacteria bacterium]|nr:dihydroorotate dehydrogenase-like protein [Deltaproteobacteria bacterium]